MTNQRPKIAALIADAFQEEEYFFPKVALNEAGYQVEVVSSHKEPVEIYSYFARTGPLPTGRCSSRCAEPPAPNNCKSRPAPCVRTRPRRSEEHTSELQSQSN